MIRSGLHTRYLAADSRGHTGHYRLRAEVPDGIFTLAVEASETAARTEHAAFAYGVTLVPPPITTDR